MRILSGYVLLFVLYQLPQGLFDYVISDRRVWMAATLLFFLGAWLVGGRSFAGYGLPSGGGWGRKLALGAAIGFIFCFGVSWFGWMAGSYSVERVNRLLALAPMLFLTGLGSFLASASEDILTRGYVWRYWPAPRGVTFVAASAVLYVLNHIYVLSRGPALWIFLLLLGLSLAWPLWKTGSMWLTIGLHWGWNLVFHWSGLALETRSREIGISSTWFSAMGAAAMLSTVVWLCRKRPGTN
jgi:membrane protease YdiL (CAAX protease family)